MTGVKDIFPADAQCAPLQNGEAGRIMRQISRKPIRLPDYDYSRDGAYFVTICVKDRVNLFWDATARVSASEVPLNGFGRIVESVMLDIPEHYAGIAIDHYVVMPNHVHLLIRFEHHTGKTTLSTVINQCKGIISKRLGFSPWQKLFYDHVVRNRDEYERIWNYIDENPLKWEDDIYFEPFIDP